MSKAKSVISIKKAKSRLEQELLKDKNVQGVGITEERGEPVILVYAVRKSKVLMDKLPSEVEGYKVKVEVTGEIKAL